MGQGLIIRNPTPQWLTDPSVTDSAMTKALRMIGQLIGADDPTSQVLGIMSTLVPSAGKAGGAVAKVIEKVKGIKAYQGSPHDFPAERLVRYQDGRTEYLVGRPDVLPDVPHGAEVMKDFPLGRQRSDKIGTGEGAQAYGHGLYFADQEATARAYRDTLSGPSRVQVNQAGNQDPQQLAIPLFRSLGKRNGASQARKLAESFPEQREAYLKAADIIESGDPFAAVSPGRMYEVNIKADPDAFLDWDKPLSQQSEQVQRSINSAYRGIGGKTDVMPDHTGKTAVQILQEQAAMLGDASGNFRIEATPSGKSFRVQQGSYEYGTYRTREAAETRMRALVDAHSDTGASAYQKLGANVVYPSAGNNTGASARLREAGIPGIKYLDGGSRAAGEGSRNYVVFDDSIIDILKKYGLLPAAVGTGAAMSQEQTR